MATHVKIDAQMITGKEAGRRFPFESTEDRHPNVIDEQYMTDKYRDAIKSELKRVGFHDDFKIIIRSKTEIETYATH